MRKFRLFFGFVVLLVSNLQTQVDAQTINVGGVSIRIPTPDTSFVSVKKEEWESINIIAPNSNKLLCAFVLNKDYEKYKSGTSDPINPEKYATIQIAKGLENFEINETQFKELTNSISKTFKKFDLSTVAKSQNEIKQRTNSDIKIGVPTSLGCFFSKPNLYGYGILAATEENGETVVKAIAVDMIRVKNRCLMIYTTVLYKGDDSLIWLRNISEKWGDKILKANQTQIKRK